MSERCGNCKFYQKSVGCCRRYPPTHYGQDYYKQARSDYPSVSVYNWCGEWKLLKEVE